MVMHVCGASVISCAGVLRGSAIDRDAMIHPVLIYRSYFATVSSNVERAVGLGSFFDLRAFFRVRQVSARSLAADEHTLVL